MPTPNEKAVSQESLSPQKHIMQEPDAQAHPFEFAWSPADAIESAAGGMPTPNEKAVSQESLSPQKHVMQEPDAQAHPFEFAWSPADAIESAAGGITPQELFMKAVA